MAFQKIDYQKVIDLRNSGNKLDVDCRKGIESGKYSSLRELMSPEEIARYDAYWNKVAGEKLTSVGNQKAFEILETQSKNLQILAFLLYMIQN